MHARGLTTYSTDACRSAIRARRYGPACAPLVGADSVCADGANLTPLLPVGEGRATVFLGGDENAGSLAFVAASTWLRQRRHSSPIRPALPHADLSLRPRVR